MHKVEGREKSGNNGKMWVRKNEANSRATLFLQLLAQLVPLIIIIIYTLPLIKTSIRNVNLNNFGFFFTVN